MTDHNQDDQNTQAEQAEFIRALAIRLYAGQLQFGADFISGIPFIKSHDEAGAPVDFKSEARGYEILRNFLSNGGNHEL